MKTQIMGFCILTAVVFGWMLPCSAENIDPDNLDEQYCWSENCGWLNWEPGAGSGVEVTDYLVSGFIWSENIGWINLRYQIAGTGPDTGIINDGLGNLSGYAWSENAGWINFAPHYGGVRIAENGIISGWAWGENIGWIHLQAGIQLSITRASSDKVELAWQGNSGYMYDILYTVDFSSWYLADNVTGSGSMLVWTDLIERYDKKFYRIEQTYPQGYSVKTAW